MTDRVILLEGTRHVVTQCGSCGVHFTVPEIVYNQHREEGGYHHCPNGHQWGWREGQKQHDDLRLERDRLKQQTAQLQDEVAAERKRADAAEKRVVQVRKRAAAGVCPCCNRTFENVQRHMKARHPNVVPLAQKQA